MEVGPYSFQQGEVWERKEKEDILCTGTLQETKAVIWDTVNGKVLKTDVENKKWVEIKERKMLN